MTTTDSTANDAFGTTTSDGQDPLPFFSSSAVDVRTIPGEAEGLLRLWAEDIKELKAKRFDRSLSPKRRNLAQAALGERRTVWGIVSVLSADLSSPKGTIALLEGRIAAITADRDAAATGKLRRVHAVRLATVQLALVELLVSLNGGGIGVAALAA